MPGLIKTTDEKGKRYAKEEVVLQPDVMYL
jgi:hypothetical protein